MSYLVTGATGFIGQHLLERLLARERSVHALVRAGSKGRLLELAKQRCGARAELVVPWVGDITLPACGLPDEVVRALQGKVGDLFHLAADYDLNSDRETAERANVLGTRHVVDLANRLGCRLHHVSSIAVAGDYNGVFREDMFAEGQTLKHPNFATKYEAELCVRRDCRVPYRIYRPAIVVGSSKTGEADEIDGPYYAFKPIQRLRYYVPQWLPLPGLEGRRLWLAPVDYVADGIDCLAHIAGLDGRAFHLVDPLYEAFPALSPERAADMVLSALVHRPKQIGTRVGDFVSLAYAFAPKLVERAFSIGLRLFPDGAEAAPDAKPDAQRGPNATTGLARLVQAVHW
jgi:thioester reductase-like protein